MDTHLIQEIHLLLSISEEVDMELIINAVFIFRDCEKKSVNKILL